MTQRRAPDPVKDSVVHPAEPTRPRINDTGSYESYSLLWDLKAFGGGAGFGPATLTRLDGSVNTDKFSLTPISLSGSTVLSGMMERASITAFGTGITTTETVRAEVNFDIGVPEGQSYDRLAQKFYSRGVSGFEGSTTVTTTLTNYFSFLFDIKFGGPDASFDYSPTPRVIQQVYGTTTSEFPAQPLYLSGAHELSVNIEPVGGSFNGTGSLFASLLLGARYVNPGTDAVTF